MDAREKSSIYAATLRNENSSRQTNLLGVLSVQAVTSNTLYNTSVYGYSDIIVDISMKYLITDDRFPPMFNCFRLTDVTLLQELRIGF
jgi:hypothetical protein